MLHVRVGGGDQLCGAQYHRPGCRDCDGPLDVEADLPVTPTFPLVGVVWLLGLSGRLPRVLPSTKGEGHERRYFYGSVWAVSVAQPILGLLWVWLPKNQQHEHH